jgi:alpha-galactosidase
MYRPSGPRWLLLVSVALVAVCAARPLADDPPLVVSHEDAYITHDPTSAVWAIGNGSIQLVVGFDASRNFVVQSLQNPTDGNTLDIDQAADTSVTIGGDRLLLNQSSDKMTLVSALPEETDNGVRLTFTFQHQTLHSLIKRAYAVYPGSPTIETWTRIEAQANSPPVDISNLIGWQLTMPVGPVRWIDGLRGDSAGDPLTDLSSFDVEGGDLDDGVETIIGSTGRSSENFVPLVFVDNGEEEFYGGVIWSGSWQLGMLRAGDRVIVAATFPNTVTSLTPDRPIEFPHTFFGYTEHTTASEQAALRQFVLGGIRHGRPIVPLVTYNTWYPYGATLTEADVDEGMRRAASIGVELYVIDAAWYVGSGADGPGDYSSGLGSYEVDPDRFPARLVGMSDQAHSLGMKFGLWIEPERIALSTIHTPGLAQESWLATEDGSYGTDGRTAQLCLASAQARKWVVNKIVNLIETLHPDYLKWDNNFWINCNRAGHGHGPNDGNYSHVLGLYEVLDEIRMRYPDLLIENVAGGGNRLDYGLLAYTDSAWMDDSTSPSEHVRHNIEGLSYAFPPAYLLSFVIDSEEEPIAGGADLPQIVRSRDPGVLGLTYRWEDLDPDTSLALAAEIARYKLLRDTITQSAAMLLSVQAPLQQDGWDVVQEVSGDQRNALIFAFKSTADDGQIVVTPQNLTSGATYDVTSLDNGVMGSATGADLMRDGVQLVHTEDGSRAHIIVFTAE